MPPKLDEKAQQAEAAPPVDKPTMMFTGAQFERLMKSFDAPSQRAAAAAEAAQAAAHSMQQALDLLRAQGQGQAGAAVATQPCLLYTSPSPRDLSTSRMPSSAWKKKK